MAVERLFSGSGLSAVDPAGRTRLPAFVRQAAIARSGGRTLILGAHETDDCISGFDPGHSAGIEAELERRRLAEESAASPPRHHERARRLFGLAEEAAFDGRGAIRLPALLRRRGRISELALFIGTGRTFEIWDPALALEAGGPDLRAIAEFRLEMWDQEGETE